MNIGRRIKHFRNRQGLTAMQLADMVNISREHLSAVENNIKPVSLTTLQKICDSLGVTLAEFFVEENKALPTEYKELLENAKALSPKQLKILNDFLKTLNE